MEGEEKNKKQAPSSPRGRAAARREARGRRGRRRRTNSNSRVEADEHEENGVAISNNRGLSSRLSSARPGTRPAVVECRHARTEHTAQAAKHDGWAPPATTNAPHDALTHNGAPNETQTCTISHVCTVSGKEVFSLLVCIFLIPHVKRTHVSLLCTSRLCAARPSGGHIPPPRRWPTRTRLAHHSQTHSLTH